VSLLSPPFSLFFRTVFSAQVFFFSHGGEGAIFFFPFRAAKGEGSSLCSSMSLASRFELAPPFLSLSTPYRTFVPPDCDLQKRSLFHQRHFFQFSGGVLFGRFLAGMRPLFFPLCPCVDVRFSLAN